MQRKVDLMSLSKIQETEVINRLSKIFDEYCFLFENVHTCSSNMHLIRFDIIIIFTLSDPIWTGRGFM